MNQKIVDDESIVMNSGLKNYLSSPISYSSTRVLQCDRAHLKRSRLITPESSSELIYSYKLLRTQIVKKLDENGWNSLAVLGDRSGSGATLTAINLAISIALEHRYTVLLVDLNFKRPAIHRYLGCKPDYALHHVLVDEVSISDALFNPGIDSLVVLPSIEKMNNSSEILTSPRMTAIIDDLKAKYQSRVVIFDLPPMLEADDALAFMPHYDAALLVMNDGGTVVKDVQLMADFLRGKPVLGTVLNRHRHALGFT